MKFKRYDLRPRQIEFTQRKASMFEKKQQR
jgi:hypothetical protein